MLYQCSYALQIRNMAKLNANQFGTAAYMKSNAGMGFANAAKATITYQKTRPCVTVRIHSKNRINLLCTHMHVKTHARTHARVHVRTLTGCSPG